MNPKTKGTAWILNSAVFFATYGVWSHLMGHDFGEFSQAWTRGLILLVFVVLVGKWKKLFKPMPKKRLALVFGYCLNRPKSSPLLLRLPTPWGWHRHPFILRRSGHRRLPYRQTRLQRNPDQNQTDKPGHRSCRPRSNLPPFLDSGSNLAGYLNHHRRPHGGNFSSLA